MGYPTNLDGDVELFLQFSFDIFSDLTLTSRFGSGKFAVGAATLAVLFPFVLVLVQLGGEAVNS